jgi:hypothetical protein
MLVTCLVLVQSLGVVPCLDEALGEPHAATTASGLTMASFGGGTWLAVHDFGYPDCYCHLVFDTPTSSIGESPRDLAATYRMVTQSATGRNILPQGPIPLS